MTVPTAQNPISVAVRVRPFTAAERARLAAPPEGPLFHSEGSLESAPPPRPRGIRPIINVVDDKMLVFDPPEGNPVAQVHRRVFGLRMREYRFVFDELFDGGALQQEVFERTAAPLLDGVLDGYNATVFAYGATGCGKTHTVSGSESQPGLVPLAMRALYDRMECGRATELSVSYLEIYNERIRDLLAPETPSSRLVLREDDRRRISVLNLLVHRPAGFEEAMALVGAGTRNRTLSPTEANAALLRLHAVLQINVLSREGGALLHEEHLVATLSIIDLAGLERAAATRNRGARLAEGANINRLLLALGNCINALCGGRAHVPYRNLKLTRLLKFSLGGNCKTAMIVCVLPSSEHYDETLNTLKYANRAREISTSVSRNRHSLDRHVGLYLKMIAEQQREIDGLRAREALAAAAARDAAARNHLALLAEALRLFAALRARLAQQHGDVARKYHSLAKRQLLLVQQRDLAVLLAGLPRDAALAAPARRLQHKCAVQIDQLERLYDAACDMDGIFARAVALARQRLAQMPGWSPAYAALLDELAQLVRDSLQRDFLAGLLILFDYLTAELDGARCLPRGLAALALARPDERTQALDAVAATLERLTGADHDVMIEEYTARFVRRRAELKRPALPLPVPVRKRRDPDCDMSIDGPAFPEPDPGKPRVLENAPLHNGMHTGVDA